MKKLVAQLSIPVVMLALQGTSFGQILTENRCVDARQVPVETAQKRYAWAAYCRSTPPPGRSGELFLTNESVIGYNTAAFDLRQRLYPVYLNWVDFTRWDVPVSAYQYGNNCNALLDGTKNVGLCTAGCFPGDALVTFSSGDVAIKNALDSGRIDLVTLSEDATLDDLDYATNEVAAYTADVFEAWQTVYTFSMASGGSLRVTSEHPILVADGRMRQAKSIQAGESLVKSDGSPDEVMRVDAEQYFGKVYHVKPKTLDYVSNIIVAQGYLNGSARYQNEYLEMVNQVILRRALQDVP